MATGFDASATRRSWGLDGWAAGVSCLCLIHCVALPLALLALPVLHGLTPGDEWSERIHYALIALAMPFSGLALWRGWRLHRRTRPLLVAGLGLALLLLGALAHDMPLFAYDEQILTVAGGLLVAWAHVTNWRWRTGRA